MKTITLTIELTYDDTVMHGNDERDIKYFYEKILEGKMSLYSYEIGDTVGEALVVSYQTSGGVN